MEAERWFSPVAPVAIFALSGAGRLGKTREETQQWHLQLETESWQPLSPIRPPLLSSLAPTRVQKRWAYRRWRRWMCTDMHKRDGHKGDVCVQKWEGRLSTMFQGGFKLTSSSPRLQPLPAHWQSVKDLLTTVYVRVLYYRYTKWLYPTL